MGKISKRMIAFLLWMQDNQPVSMFPNEWCVMWKKARTNKFVQDAGREEGRFGLTKYILSESGVEIIRNKPPMTVLAKTLDTENWKPIAGYEGLYEVSDMGSVRSIRRNLIKSPAAKRYQYGLMIPSDMKKAEADKPDQAIPDKVWMAISTKGLEVSTEMPNHDHVLDRAEFVRTDLCVRPVDPSSLKRNVETDRNKRAAKTWNDCVDYLTAQGYLKTPEGK